MRPSEHPEIERNRWEILERFDSWLETPMILLGFVWLALLIAEIVWQLPTKFEVLSNFIWIIFVVDFAIKILLAPNKSSYLRANWLTAIALVLPALRILRIAKVFRAARAARGLRLVRIVTSLNRGMRSLGEAMGRRGLGYIIVLTLLVVFVGAAGMYTFESDNPDGRGLNDYGTALWWTAMIITTMGSEYWPQTPEGRLLCLLLAIYAFAVFGYVTAAVASYFVTLDQDARKRDMTA